MENLFAKGKSFAAWPMKIVSLVSEKEMPFPAQAMFVVPKRLFKRANRRNTLKRRMREAYRLNKSNLYDLLKQKNKNLLLAFIYTGKEEEDYAVIEKGMLKALKKLIS